MYKSLLSLVFLIGTSLALFSGEEFVYNNETKFMTQWVTVELRKQATIPLSLSLNTLCTVPSFQLTGIEFLNSTNGNKKRAPYQSYLECLYKNQGNQLACTAVMPSGTRVEDCNGIQYCVNKDKTDSTALLRDKGSCEGAGGRWTYMLDEECLNKKKNRILDDVRSYSEQARKESYNLVETTIWETFNRTADEINNFLSNINNTVNGIIGQVQSEVVAATTEYSAMFTRSLNTAFGSLVKQGNDAVRELSLANSQRMLQLQGNLQGLGNLIASNSRVMSSAIIRSVGLDTRAQNDLKTYISGIVDKANLVQLSLETYRERLNLAVANLLIRSNNNNLLESQGEDISTLLTQWFSLVNGSNVLQDLTRQSTYNYALSAYVDRYGPLAVEADPQDEIVGKAVYECYEEGEEIDYGSDVVGEITATTNYKNQDTSIIDRVAYWAPNDTSRSGRSSFHYNRLLQALSLPYSKMEIYRKGKREGYTYIDNTVVITGSRDLTECSITPFVHIQLYNSTGQVYFKYYYGDKPPSSDCSSLTLQAACGSSARSCEQDWSSPNATLLFGIIPTGTKPFRKDKGDPIYLIDDISSMLSSVSPDSLNVTAAGIRGWNDEFVMTNIYLTSTYKGALLRTVLPGSNNFYLQHPTRGAIKIHKCSRVISPIITQEGKAVAELDGNFLIRTGGILYPGRKTAKVSGMPQKDYVQILVSQNTDDHNLRPDRYAYSKDQWCCGEDDNPLVTNQDCVGIGLKLCRSAPFANCTVNGARMLTMVRGGVCPGGSVPSVTETRYLSPNTYYCAKGAKNTNPLLYGLEYCDVKSMRMPGAGVEIETGVISPQGYYPAKCVYWSEAQGEADLHVIHVNVTDKTLPTLIANLRGSKIVFKVTGDSVVDEMEDLMGIGNGGYDCVTYELDKILHRPKNCRNYLLPQYNTTSYFAGRVRTSGISRLLDFFDISMISNNASVVLLNFTLKEGIDYQAAYFAPTNLCPRLQVEYTTGNPKYCKVSGWDATGADVDVQVNTVSVCQDGLCDTEKSILNGRNVTIDIVVGGKKSNCYKFVCMANTQSFVAYPGETFETLTQRIKKVEAISRITGYDYGSVVDNLMQELEDKIANASSQIILGGLGELVEINMTLPAATPEYRAIASSVNTVAEQGKAAISNITAEQQAYLVNITKSGLQAISARGREMFDNHTRSHAILIEQIKAQLQVTVTVQESSMFDWINTLQEGYENSMQSIVTSAIALVLSTAICGLSLYVFVKC